MGGEVEGRWGGEMGRGGGGGEEDGGGEERREWIEEERGGEGEGVVGAVVAGRGWSPNNRERGGSC